MFLMSKVMVSSFRMQQQSLEHQVINLAKQPRKEMLPISTMVSGSGQ